MRSLLRSGAAAIVFGLLAAPVLAQAEFHGGGFLSDFTPACVPDGWSGVQQVVARVRPANEGGNPNQTVINLFMDSYTLHYRFPPAAVNVWTDTTEATTIGGNFSSQTSPRPRIRLVTAPTSTVWSADERHIIAEINNFSYLANCQVRVNLWLYRR